MKCKCKRCGYEWNSYKNATPRVCANKKCKSATWNKDRGKLLEINAGDVYGYLTVLEPITSPTEKGERGCCLVKCECGIIKKVKRREIFHGRIKSCGCRSYLGQKRTTYKYKNTPEYNCWVGIRQRCNNPKASGYKYYGARGIKVCERWDSFGNFLNDMGERPDGTSIDRIDNNGDYEPSNTKWSTPSEQSSNTRRTHFIAHDGEIKTLSQWADSLNISVCTLSLRIKNWGIEKAVTLPRNTKHSDRFRMIELFGVTKTMNAWSKLCPTRSSIFRARLKNGWPIEQALVFPPMPTGRTYGNYLNNIKKNNE
jgi:hypothetical protein